MKCNINQKTLTAIAVNGVIATVQRNSNLTQLLEDNLISKAMYVSFNEAF